MANETFFSALAKTLESDLLNQNQLQSLIECKTLEDISRALNEYNVSKGIKIEKESDLKNFITKQQKDFLAFVNQSSPQEKIKKYFTFPFDYFNLESIYIANKLDKNSAKTLPSGKYSVESLKECVKNRRYEFLTNTMQKCLTFCDEQFDKNIQSGFVMDTAFKRAKYFELQQVAKGNKHLEKLTTFRVDCVNINLALRLRNFTMFTKCMVDGGSLKMDYLKMLNENDFKEIQKAVKYDTYRIIIELQIKAIMDKIPMDKYEKMVETFPLRYFEDMRFDNDVIYLRYCFLKLDEIRKLQIIFEGFSFKQDKRLIKNQLGRVYAK